MQNLEDFITPDIKAIIFDLDGTLADTLPLHMKAWLSAAKVFDIHVTTEMVKANSGTPTLFIADKLNKQYGWGIDPQKFADKKMEFYYKHKNEHGLIQPIKPLVEIARKFHKVLPLAVGTGSKRDSALKSLGDIQALHLFDSIVTATDVNNPKPHPETFLKCAEAMGVNPEECLVFEDGAMGILAAQRSGMKLVDVKPYL